MSTTTPDLAKLHAEINQHPYVKLLRSKDPMMWYSSRVGEMIRVIGVNLDGYWARESDKYNAINVIRFSDCEWVPHPLSHITPPAPDVPQGNDPVWTLASKVREALYRKACPGYYIDVAVEAVVYNYIYAPAAPDYSWPTVEDYEKCSGFSVNDAFRIGWNMARTTDTMLGIKSDTPTPAAPAPAVPQGEPVYQLARATGPVADAWIDVAKDVYDDAGFHPSDFKRRILYAAPSQPAVPQGWTDADSDAARLALELECLLLDTENLSVVSKWWASANEALELHRRRLATPAAPSQEPYKDSTPHLSEKEALR